MASQVPSQSLCLFCFELVESEKHFDKLLAIRPNLMGTLYNRRATYVNVSTKKDAAPKYNEETHWEKDKKSLSPLSVGFGPCNNCSERVPKDVKNFFQANLRINNDRETHKKELEEEAETHKKKIEEEALNKAEAHKKKLAEMTSGKGEKDENGKKPDNSSTQNKEKK